MVNKNGGNGRNQGFEEPVDDVEGDIEHEKIRRRCFGCATLFFTEDMITAVS